MAEGLMANVRTKPFTSQRKPQGMSAVAAADWLARAAQEPSGRSLAGARVSGRRA